MSLSSATDSSDAESDSSYESDSPEPEASPLPASRPQKAMEIVRYDTIKAVWLPRNKFAENSKILQGMGALWEVTRTIRDRWNQDRDAVKKAVETKKDGELPLLKERVEKQREMMEAVLKASVQYGHPDLLSAYVYPFPHFPVAMCTTLEIFRLIVRDATLRERSAIRPYYSVTVYGPVMICNQRRAEFTRVVGFADSVPVSKTSKSIRQTKTSRSNFEISNRNTFYIQIHNHA